MFLFMAKLKYDLTGQRFGRLVALEHVGRGVWSAACDCGAQTTVQGGKLRAELPMGTRSCGCAQPVRQQGAGHPRWRGDRIAYSTAHKRVSSRRGRATEHNCVACGERAHSWSYRGGSEKELIEDRGEHALIKRIVRYSPDPDDYDPMCWTCHIRKDLAERQTRV